MRKGGRPPPPAGSTGTRFFTHLMRAWQYPSEHWKCHGNNSLTWTKVRNASHPCLSRAAFLDDGEVADVEWLIKSFADARFVLNTRSLEPWMASRIYHARRARGKEHLMNLCHAGNKTACELKNMQQADKDRSRAIREDIAPQLDCDEKVILESVVSEARHQEHVLRLFNATWNRRQRFVMVSLETMGGCEVSKMLRWVTRKNWTTEYTADNDLVLGPHELPPGSAQENCEPFQPRTHAPTSSSEQARRVLLAAGCTEEMLRSDLYMPCARQILSRRKVQFHPPGTNIMEILHTCFK